MTEGISLAKWSNLLLDEIFHDREGKGNPVSTIDAGGALLAKSLAHADVQVSDGVALEMFVAAFPSRWQMLRWFSGVESPGAALLAFLILCCIAASESAGSAVSDYRERLRQMMDWDAIIVDCAGLPVLWRRLATALAFAASSRRLRRLCLPDPRHRTQIGHAIELTFPSQQDARRLRRDLGAGAILDADRPVVVLRWLAPRVSHYSPTFGETFRDFQSAWLSGERSLKDHRFWSGWSMVLEAWRPRETNAPFQIVSDEWGRHQLLTLDGDPLELRSLERNPSTPTGLRTLLNGGTPILLREIDWGVWTWCGSGRAAARQAKGALVREKSHSAILIAQLGLTAVAGASGWGFTEVVDTLSGTAGRLSVDDDDLIDISISGIPRVDGGWLARPSFPIIISTTGPVGAITLSGPPAPDLVVSRKEAQRWTITPTKALGGEVTVNVEPYATGDCVVRILALRRAVVVPNFERDLPSRFAIDEEAAPPWTPSRVISTAATAFAPWRSIDGRPPKQGLLDLVEYLAARPGPMPLGGLLDLLDSIDHGVVGGKWSIARALLEAGALEPLRIRGWRGSAVIPRGPRAVLCRTLDGYRLLLDGLVSETLIDRAGAMAIREGLQTSLVEGPSDWSPRNAIIHGPSEDALLALATDLALPVEWLAPDLSGLTSPMTATPNGDGGGHASRRQIQTADLAPLENAGVRLLLCRREADDAHRVWLVKGHGGGQERFWTHRHTAVLDACRIGGLKPFTIEKTLLHVTQPGAFLPLAMARWIRMATGASAGPTDFGHVYALTPSVETAIRDFLGPLLLEPRPRVLDLGAPRRAPSPALATAIGSSVATAEIWRWARDRPGCNP
jgi:hypothetical protein